MQSKVVKLADYTALIKSFKLDYKLDEEILNEELNRIIIKNKRLDKVNQVENGDIVTVNLESEIKKFNKNSVKIVVGSNYFSQEFESQLLGLALNENRNIEVNDFVVKTEIIEILRTSLPELSDDLIKKENIDGVNTIDDYKKRIYEMYKEKYIQNEVFKLSMNILKKLSEESKFDIIEDEVLKLYNAAIDFFRKTAKEEGLIFEEMTTEELLPRLAAKSVEEVKIREKNYCLSLVKSAAICSEILKKDISTMDTNRDNIFLLQNEFRKYLRKELGI